MDLDSLYRLGLIVIFGAAALMFPVLFFIPAPWRHRRAGFGPEINAKLAWLIQESPAVFMFLAGFLASGARVAPVPLIFLALWQAHYLQRSLLFPLLMRGEGKRIPVLTMGLAILFNFINPFVNGYVLTHLGSRYELAWLNDPRFIVGTALFVFGYAVNLQSDSLLRNLRRPGESGYRIPYGGFFRWVTSPNYLGEIIEWSGWALATWSLPGLGFALFTAANLVPRAWSHHRWYREQFPEYPPERKAVLPGIF